MGLKYDVFTLWKWPKSKFAQFWSPKFIKNDILASQNCLKLHLSLFAIWRDQNLHSLECLKLMKSEILAAQNCLKSKFGQFWKHKNYQNWNFRSLLMAWASASEHLWKEHVLPPNWIQTRSLQWWAPPGLLECSIWCTVRFKMWFDENESFRQIIQNTSWNFPWKEQFLPSKLDSNSFSVIVGCSRIAWTLHMMY